MWSSSRFCQDVLDAMSLVCILEAKSITFGFGNTADRQLKQNEGCKQRRHTEENELDRCWTAGAGAETVMAKKLQYVAGDQLRR